MVNKVILLGNVGQDPEVRRMDSGAVVARFSLATNERWKDKEGNPQTNTEWHNVVVWRQLAEIAEKYVKKGRQLYVEGKLSHRKYTDANGVEKYVTDVVANNFQLLGSRDGGSGGSGFMPSAADEPAKTNNNGSAPMATAPATTPKPEEVTDAAGDDLPF
jgi:single-strand DNA-binding protein